MIPLGGGITPVEEILKSKGLDSGGPSKWGNSFWTRAMLCPYDGVRLQRDGFEESCSPALVLGTIVHCALALYYRNQVKDVDKAMQVISCIKDWADTQLAEYPTDYAKLLYDSALSAESILLGYFTRWQVHNNACNCKTRLFSIHDLETCDPPEYCVKMVEEEVYTKDEFYYSARYDLVLEINDIDGSPCTVLMDHKTTSRDTALYESSYWQNMQLAGHLYLWNKEMMPKGYPEARYAVINLIIKPSSVKQKPKYRRIVYAIRPERVSVWRHQMLLNWGEFFKYMPHITYDTEGPIWYNTRQNWAACFNRGYGKSCPRLDECLAICDFEGAEQLKFDLLCKKFLAIGDFDVSKYVAWIKKAKEEELRSYSKSLDAAYSGDNPKFFILNKWITLWSAKNEERKKKQEEDEIRELEKDTKGTKKEESAEGKEGVGSTGSNEDKVDTSIAYRIQKFKEGPIKAIAVKAKVPCFVRKNLMWGTGKTNGDGEPIFLVKDDIEIAVAPDAEAYLVDILPEIQQSKDDGAVVIDYKEGKIGKAPSDEGVLPVIWVGQFDQSFRFLLDQIKESRIGDKNAYYVSRIGKNPEKRQLRVWSFAGKKLINIRQKDLGSETWTNINRMVEEHIND